MLVAVAATGEARLMRTTEEEAADQAGYRLRMLTVVVRVM